MDQGFDIKYYDGQIARGRAARLYLRANAWEIHIPGNETAPPQLVRWPLDEIHPNQRQHERNNFHFGKFPHQVVECHDPGFPAALKVMYPERAFFLRQYSWFGQQNWLTLGAVAAVLLTLILLAYFYALPRVSEQLVDKIPPEYEIKLGEQLASSLMSGMELDSVRTRALQEFANIPDFQTDFPLRFYVVRSEDINAFALPGGTIVVYDALLNRIKSAEALCGLLAHEAAHVKKRHSLKAMVGSLSRYVLISLLFGDLNGILSALVDNADAIQQLSYSRELEQEADTQAAETLAYNRLDQEGLVDLFEALQGSKTPQPEDGLQFLSSHPLTANRIAFARERAAQQALPEENAALEAAFLRLNTGIVE